MSPPLIRVEETSALLFHLLFGGVYNWAQGVGVGVGARRGRGSNRAAKEYGSIYDAYSIFIKSLLV